MAAEQYKGNYKAPVTATGVVFTGACRIVKVVVTVAGSAGTWTIKDGTGDIVWSAVGTLALGTVVELDIPMDVSINVTAIGTSGTLEVLYSKGKN